MRLSEKKVAAIKAELANGKTQPAIAKQFKVSRSIVSDIATGRRHKKVPWPEGQPVKRPGGQRKLVPGFDPTDERVKELEAELLHVRDERELAKRSAKAASKQHGLFKAIADELAAKCHPFKALPPARKIVATSRKVIEEHVVMHLSDGHHDQVVTLEESGGMEEYNFPISCRRAETYVDTLLDWTQSTLSPRFKFTVLTILAYGDHTSGEIHNHVQRSYFKNQFKNCFAIGQLHALMYRDLAPHFDAINVLYLPGNHGRRTPKKDYHGAHDNWDYLVAETAKNHCRDIPNVSFLIPNAFSVNIDINGVGFNVSHGDDVAGNSGIPFYGMVRRQKGLIALGAARGGPRVRYFCMGHHHVQGKLSDIDGALVLNGAWPGTDSYALNKFSGYREPSQLIHGVNPKHGITWEMNVHLKTPDERKGPTRYRIEV
jgi:hypothetical protein